MKQLNMMNNALFQMGSHVFLFGPFRASHARIGASNWNVEADKSVLPHLLRHGQVLPALGARSLTTTASMLRELTYLEYGTAAFWTPNFQLLDLLGRFLVVKKVT
jgi:hypothetical protein